MNSRGKSSVVEKMENITMYSNDVHKQPTGGGEAAHSTALIPSTGTAITIE